MYATISVYTSIAVQHDSDRSRKVCEAKSKRKCGSLYSPPPRRPILTRWRTLSPECPKRLLGAWPQYIHKLSGGDHGSGGGSILNNTRSWVCAHRGHRRRAGEQASRANARDSAGAAGLINFRPVQAAGLHPRADTAGGGRCQAHYCARAAHARRCDRWSRTHSCAAWCARLRAQDSPRARRARQPAPQGPCTRCTPQHSTPQGLLLQP